MNENKVVEGCNTSVLIIFIKIAVLASAEFIRGTSLDANSCTSELVVRQVERSEQLRREQDLTQRPRALRIRETRVR